MIEQRISAGVYIVTSGIFVPGYAPCSRIWRFDKKGIELVSESAGVSAIHSHNGSIYASDESRGISILIPNPEAPKECLVALVDRRLKPFGAVTPNVVDFCSYNEELFDLRYTGHRAREDTPVSKPGYQIVNTLQDARGEPPLAEITAVGLRIQGKLLNYRDSLYFVYLNEPRWSNFFDVHKDPKFENPLRPQSVGYIVSAACASDDLAYHVELLHNAKNGFRYGIFNTLFDPKSERPLALRQNVTALNLHNRVLYDARERYSRRKEENVGEIFVSLEDLEAQNPIAQRSSPIRFLFSHDGRLYDAGDYGVGDTLEDKVLHVFNDYPGDDLGYGRHGQRITAIISHEK